MTLILKILGPTLMRSRDKKKEAVSYDTTSLK